MEPALGHGAAQLGGWEQQHLDCPICMSLLTDPFVSPCGHTFCYGCISTHLRTRKSCPCCLHYLTKDLIYPNFLLSKIVQKAHTAPRQGASVFELIRRTICESEAELQPAQIDSLLALLRERKAAAEQGEKDTNMGLLLHFLQRSREDKAARLEELRSELACLEKDILQVEAVTAAVATGTLADVAVPSGVDLGRESMEVPQQLPHPAPAAATVLQEAGGSSLLKQPQPQQLGEALGGTSQGSRLQQRPCTGSHAAALREQVVAQWPEQQHAQGASLEQEPLAQPTQLSQPLPPPAAWPAPVVGALAATMPQPAAIPSVPLAPRPASTGRAEPRAAALAEAGGSAAVQPHPPWFQQQQQAADESQADCRQGAGQGGAWGPAGGGEPGGRLTSHYIPGPIVAEPLGGAARQKRQRIASQFEDLQECYRQLRAGAGDWQQPEHVAATQAATEPARSDAAGAAPYASGGAPGAKPPAAGAAGGLRVGASVDTGLHELSRILSVLTRCNKLKVVGEIPRHPSRGGSSSSNIISSLEFDRGGARFATAGVSKRISIYEYASVVQVAPSHCLPPPIPVLELVTRSKLSCLAWNRQVANHIASSDYEGVVAVWDVASSALVAEYEAHTKRIWSLDYCTHHPAGPLLASASDDCTVKLWSTASPNSVGQIDMKANVCAVKWRPGSQHELAVGSADHCVYLYDTRATARPLCTLAGHRKAVSYVRFCSPGELVSASTDSTLRLWGLAGGGTQQRVFEGHLNDKNFVGLSVDGDFLACGSETNEVFVYYKALSKPVAQQSFLAPAPGAEGGDDGLEAREAARGQAQQFISAVSWHPGSHVLLVANSQGNIKLFQLTAGEDTST